MKISKYLSESINKMYNKKKNFALIKQDYLILKDQLLKIFIENKNKLQDFIHLQYKKNKKGNPLKKYVFEDENIIFEILDNIDILTYKKLNIIIGKKIRFYFIIDFIKNYLNHEIIKEYKTKIVDNLVYLNCKRVLDIANKIKIPISDDEKIQAGLTGLTDAAWRYDFRDNVNFLPYADKRIYLYIIRLIKTNLYISVPYTKLEKFSKTIIDFLKEKEKNENMSIEEYIEKNNKNATSNNSFLTDINILKEIISALDTSTISTLFSNNNIYENRTEDDYIENQIFTINENEYTGKNYEMINYLNEFFKFAQEILTPIEYDILQTLVFDHNINKKDLMNKYNIKYYSKLNKTIKKIQTKIKKYFKTEYDLQHLLINEKSKVYQLL